MEIEADMKMVNRAWLAAWLHFILIFSIFYFLGSLLFWLIDNYFNFTAPASTVWRVESLYLWVYTTLGVVAVFYLVFAAALVVGMVLLIRRGLEVAEVSRVRRAVRSGVNPVTLRVGEEGEVRVGGVQRKGGDDGVPLSDEVTIMSVRPTVSGTRIIRVREKKRWRRSLYKLGWWPGQRLWKRSSVLVYLQYFTLTDEQVSRWADRCGVDY